MGFKRRFCQCFGGSLATLALAVSPALAEELNDWAFDAATSELTFTLSDEVFPQFFLLSEPPRLVLDIPETEIGTIEPEQIYNGAVHAIRVAQHTPDQVRVVIELTPDIVLSPDQADIQFDDGEGLRHWRFRPLIAENGTAVALSPTATPPPAGQRVSLSASNLQLSVQRSTATELPIDPYAAEAASTVVSVPPLEADLSAEAASTVVSVPPLETLPVDTAVAPAEIATAPDLPPMTVPELEQPEVNHPGLDHTETLAVAAVPEHNRSSLPDINARVPSEIPDVAESVPDSPVPAMAEVAVPELGGESTKIEPEDVQPLEVISALEEVPAAEVAPAVAEVAPAVAEVAPVAEVPVVAAVAANSVSVPPAHTEPLPMAEPVTDEQQPVPVTQPITGSEQPVAQQLSPTGLAPVELSLVETPVAEDNLEATLETIQQPAARRTITQTQQPTPLTFGQPLPDAAN